MQKVHITHLCELQTARGSRLAKKMERQFRRTFSQKAPKGAQINRSFFEATLLGQEEFAAGLTCGSAESGILETNRRAFSRSRASLSSLKRLELLRKAFSH